MESILVQAHDSHRNLAGLASKCFGFIRVVFEGILSSNNLSKTPIAMFAHFVFLSKRANSSYS